jgi:hypothetical protein
VDRGRPGRRFRCSRRRGGWWRRRRLGWRSGGRWWRLGRGSGGRWRRRSCGCSRRRWRRYHRAHSRLAGGRQVGKVAFQALQSISAARRHAGAVGHEIGAAGAADGADLCWRRLLRVGLVKPQRGQKQQRPDCAAQNTPQFSHPPFLPMPSRLLKYMLKYLA